MVKRDPFYGTDPSTSDYVAYVATVALENFPLNPMSWYRTGTYILKEDEPTWDDIIMSLGYFSTTLGVIAYGKHFHPGASVGIVQATIAITSGLRPGASTLIAPSLFLGVLNTSRQMPAFQSSGMTSV